MIALCIGTSVLAGTVLGWYGHKASLRIEAWGEKVNERDRIVRSLIDEDEGAHPQGQQGAFAKATFAPSIGRIGHFPAGAAASK
jgi:hypothetical protein